MVQVEAVDVAGYAGHRTAKRKGRPEGPAYPTGRTRRGETNIRIVTTRLTVMNVATFFGWVSAVGQRRADKTKAPARERRRLRRCDALSGDDAEGCARSRSDGSTSSSIGASAAQIRVDCASEKPPACGPHPWRTRDPWRTRAPSAGRRSPSAGSDDNLLPAGR